MTIPIEKVHPLHILLVEDNADHAELVRRSLGEHRVANTVHHVTDGESALDYLMRRGRFSEASSSPRPHVVLLDLRLPRMDGLEVLRAIKDCEELRGIPVIILTTSKAEMDVARAYRHHANSYLVKPGGFDQFRQMMDEMGSYWLVWNYSPQN